MIVYVDILSLSPAVITTTTVATTTTTTTMAAPKCSSSGNIVVYSNYDGGVLNIKYDLVTSTFY